MQFDRNPTHRVKLFETRSLKLASTLAKSRIRLLAALFDATCDHFEAYLHHVVGRAMLEAVLQLGTRHYSTPQSRDHYVGQCQLRVC